MARRCPVAAAVVLALATAAPAADPKDEEAIARAIKGGQAYLKAYFNPGRGPGASSSRGRT